MRNRGKFRVLTAAAALGMALLGPGRLTVKAQASGWAQDAAGKWYYLKESGEVLKSGVTPDGYLTDLFGYWEETPCDGVVGTYRVVSDTLDGVTVEGEDLPGVSRSLTVKLMTNGHISVSEVWAYENGAVVRSIAEEYFPNTNGTFNVCYFPERRGNSLRWHDTGKYSNYAGLTDDGNGQLTLRADEDGKERVTVYQRN